jgi:MFS family permease
LSSTAVSIEVPADDHLAQRNALVLAVAQALAGGNQAVLVITGGIIGTMLAPHKGLATLPISVMVIGMWLGTLPIGALARHYGRRPALQLGATMGVLAGLICSAAILWGSFGLFLLGALCSGVYAAAHHAYRFAAADTASVVFRPKAVSWVLAGGIASAVVGPPLIIFTKDYWPPYLFSVTFLGQAALAAAAAAVLILVKIPRPPPVKEYGSGRPLVEIIRGPRFIAAAVCGAASYAMMNLVMTSAPLAMLACDHSITDATKGLQWHVLAMYIPSFFTGSMIVRFGVERIVFLGFALIIASGLVALSGIALWNFWLGLVLLGVGWNFSFVGATTMVTQCHAPAERNKVQAFNDFLVFGSMAIASFSSGQLLEAFGWMAVNYVVFPTILAAAALLAWRKLQDGRLAA